MQLCFIKDNIWEMKVNNTKGKADKYLEEFKIELDERLKNFTNENEDTINNFKSMVLNYVFSENIYCGAIDDKTVEEAYKYYLEKRKIGSKAIKLNGRWYKEDDFISIKGIDRELLLGEFDDNCINIYYRFNGIAKQYNSKEDLEKDMYTEEDIEKIIAIDPSNLSEKELIKINRILYVQFNFTYDYKRNVISPYQDKLLKNSLSRGKGFAEAITEKELSEHISNRLYKSCWDSIKEKIDSSKTEGVSALKSQFGTSGGSLCDTHYNYFNIGHMMSDGKGVDVNLRDGRVFKFTWNSIYDTIKSLNGPKQIDLFSFAS